MKDKYANLEYSSLYPSNQQVYTINRKVNHLGIELESRDWMKRYLNSHNSTGCSFDFDEINFCTVSV